MYTRHFSISPRKFYKRFWYELGICDITNIQDESNGVKSKWHNTVIIKEKSNWFSPQIPHLWGALYCVGHKQKRWTQLLHLTTLVSCLFPLNNGSAQTSSTFVQEQPVEVLQKPGDDQWQDEWHLCDTGEENQQEIN